MIPVNLPEVAGCLQERDAKGVDSDTKPGHLIAFSSKDSGGDAAEDIAPTLRSMNYDKSHINGGGQVAIAFKPSHYTRDKDGAPSEVYAGTANAVLTPNGGRDGMGVGAVATFQQSSQAGKGTIGYDESGIAKPCKTQQDGQMIHAGSAVRRLTPTECLRLQGFPDDWFDGLGFSDSTKYRMCGNAVAVCVAAWLFKRLCTVSKKNSAPDDPCDGLLKAGK